MGGWLVVGRSERSRDDVDVGKRVANVPIFGDCD